ncbi:MAG: DUF5597 domain-containing protein [Paludibaculum sp.]
MRYISVHPFALILTACGLWAQSQPAAPLPAIRTNGAVKQLFVDGQPFLMLSGELHNSSASSVTYMQPIWKRLAALHLNTVIGTVNWELLEPEEGKFNFTLVDAQIQEARRHNLRLVLIWFASWKNATSTYVPMWVKLDQRRFPRMVIKPRPDLPQHLASQMGATMPAPNLTPFGDASAAADAKAFAALMRHIKQVDPQHTVIMMQVENETGLLGDSRDRSPLAEAAWAGPVPAALMDYLTKNKASLLPELQKVWGAKGFKSSGSWAEVFGTDNFAEEAFMAWHVARYINRVVEAGKAELSLPMYVNAWLGPQPQMEQPGQYPSGGPVARVMDIYRAAGSAIDLLAPDIYVQDFKGTCALYARSGNPLFIPEARAITGHLFWALGQHSAMGFSPFGIDDVKADHQLGEAYAFLSPMLPVLAKAQAEGRIRGILLDGDQPETVSLAGYQARFTASRARVQLDAGQAPLDPAARPPQPAAPFGPPPPDTRPQGLLISTGPDEFLIVGTALMATFLPDSPGPKIVEIGTIDEGSFENGHWVAGRRLNGDEGRPAIRSGRFSAIKVKLYRRD